MPVNHNLTPAQKRKRRVRAKMHGTKMRPRVSVFRSNKHMYAQVIDDDTMTTLVSSSDLVKDVQKNIKKDTTKIQKAQFVGEDVAAKMKKKKITKASFDRGSYRYHGRVKAVAEALRKGGIKV